MPGIVGFARALELCLDEMSTESGRLAALRDRLFAGLAEAVPHVHLNGPALSVPDGRLPGNLNVSFAGVDGEALLISAPEVAASSGSACTSDKPEPSHVLRALGLSDELTRGSIRLGIGRFNTPDEIEVAIQALGGAVTRLRRMSGLAVLKPGP